MGKGGNSLQERLAHYLLRGMNKAIRDYGMISDGDRVAVAVSGGKDSLSLLRLLLLRQGSCRTKYEVVAVHVDRLGLSAVGRLEGWEVLERHLQAEGCSYCLEIVNASHPLECSRCSYLRRKALFTAAQRLGCGKVALGHHTDDAAQTTLLNLVFHGRVETLLPTRQFFGGQVEVIRPLIYLREKEILRFAQAAQLPAAPAACPNSRNSRRVMAKALVRQLEKVNPRVKVNLFRAGLRMAQGIDHVRSDDRGAFVEQ